MLPMNLAATTKHVSAITVLQIIIIEENKIQFKISEGGVTKIVLYDFTNMIENIVYGIGTSGIHELGGINNAPVNGAVVFKGQFTNGKTYNPNNVSTFFIVNHMGTKQLGVKISGLEDGRDFDRYIDDYSNLPIVVYLASGETATNEPADETILFPPLESPEEFIERISARLLHLTKKMRNLRHEEPHQNARSRRICLDVGDHEEVDRYDHTCNLLKLPCGYLSQKLAGYIQYYDAYLKSIEDLPHDAPVPDFVEPTGQSGREYLETLLEKLENAFADDNLLEEHFDRHNHEEWFNNFRERKVVLCKPDCSVGEVIFDINALHTDSDGIAHTIAEQHFHELSTKWWVYAKRTPFRNLVTERTVTLPS